jgi:regulator of replication initiation timing
MMDESYKSFKDSYLDLMARLHESTEREHKLWNGNKELERRLAKSEAESAVEKEKVKLVAREAADWKAKYEDLKSTLQSALGQDR